MKAMTIKKHNLEAKDKLLATLNNLIPTYLVYVGFLYYFFQIHSTEFEAANIFIGYGAAVSLFLLFHFFIYCKRLQDKEAQIMGFFFNLSYVFIGLSILFLSLINEGFVKTNLASQTIIYGIFFPTIIYLIAVPFISAMYLILKPVYVAMVSKPKSSEKPKPSVKVSPWKIIFLLFLTGLLFWFTLESFKEPNAEKIKMIIELSVTVAGFGLIGFVMFDLVRGNKDRYNTFKSWFADLKKSVLYALVSLMSGFIFLNAQTDVWYYKPIFYLTVGAFFYSVILFFGFILCFNPDEYHHS